MNINDIYVLIQYIINKNQQGYLNPAQFNHVINQAQRSYLSYLLGSFQSYLPGRPVSRVELGQNSVIRQRLAPVILSTELGIDMYGVSQYPSDYLQADAMRDINTFQRIRFVQQDSLYSYYNSAIDPIDSNPIYMIENEGFRFYPAYIGFPPSPDYVGSAKLSYVSNPPDMNWGYELSNGRPVYSPEKMYFLSEFSPTNGWGDESGQYYIHTPGYSDPLIFTDPTPLIGNYYEIYIICSNLISGSFYVSFGGLSMLISTEGTHVLRGIASTNSPFTLTPTTVNLDCNVSVNPSQFRQISQQPVWDDLSIFDIIQRALSMISVNLQSVNVGQYAEQIKREGQ